MTRGVSATIILTAMLAGSTISAPAHAQSPGVSRTWVSGAGDDGNACTRTAPCKTFAGAISRTVTGGEINCIDPGGYGALTISKSITIDCHETLGSVLTTSGSAFSINLDSQANMIVRIRNISFDGQLSAATGIAITGTSSGSGNNAISIEDCVIDGFLQFGIADTRSIGGRLLVKNTIIRNGAGTGVGIAPVSGTSAVKATFDNVSVFDWNFGFGIGNGVQILIKNSMAASNTFDGVHADNGALVAVSASTISGNGTGIFVGNGGTVRIGNTDIAFNTTGINGTVQTFVDNRITNNGAGGTLSPVGGSVTNPQGLQ